MNIRLSDLAVQEVIADVLAMSANAELGKALQSFAQTPEGARQMTEATLRTASTLLLAKTAMPQENDRFTASAVSEMKSIRPYSALVGLALALIEAEILSVDDLFRDRRIITDSLFALRLDAMKQSLLH
jgi:hypothetical protein